MFSYSDVDRVGGRVSDHLFSDGSSLECGVESQPVRVFSCRFFMSVEGVRRPVSVSFLTA